ncbi:hypothetical protein E3Q22_01817 [Wallemia mellicola]|uniref:Nudix hydrolase domain-containing protein n=2 Tax=Wallemia mellicola TaxID=1708541 RepID=A0A4T0RGJ9_9BASI|nr:hypothetical protein E3Q22_01817 [Wallemia mellicola]TIB86665.1 hypothetical protein E3Q21_01579 [Wallemia mellicola]TIB89645.1 hypothetical protein E3Q20_01624 [Wallemia mellicola]TIB93024.1 hypothetical protein E3Q19_01584 [Wallemia mellicola]TIB99066.1 hypothetical protein E3Q18_01802 [Wallemia mellicola]
MTNLTRILQAFKSIQSTDPQLMSSNNVKRAAVALILRFRPKDGYRNRSPTSSEDSPSNLNSIDQLFSQPWMQDGAVTPEILFIQRAARNGDRWSGHVACPGGRYEPADDNLKYTAMRECWEEIGLDISDQRQFLCLGQLDDREVTSSLGKKLLMILSPFVFVQTTPSDIKLELEPQEVESVHWIPVDLLTDLAQYTRVEVDLPTRLSPKSNIGRAILSTVLSNSTLSFPAIQLPNKPFLTAPQSGLASVTITEENEQDYAPPTPAELDETITELRKRTADNRINKSDHPTEKLERPPLKLWGLTLGFTLDFLSHIPKTDKLDTGISPESSRHLATAHVIKALFPSFNSPDINIWMWVCGRRYRSIRRQWESAALNPGSADKKKNWSGTIRSAHFAAIRKALIFTVIFRICAAFTTISIFGRYLHKFF